MRHRLAVVAAVVVAGVLTPPAVAHHRDDHAGGVDPCAAPLACGDPALPGYEYEQRIADNIWHGHVLEVDYGTPERVPGDVVSGGAWGDSGLWTGVYLGGQSFRYAVAKDKLTERNKHKALTEEQVAFWTAQRDEALARVTRFVQQYDLLVNIAREWRTTTDASKLTGNPPSFGGGVFQGEEGLLMRACAPAPSDTNRIGIAPNSNKRIFGPFTWTDGVEYYCETAPSRDTYAGTIYGLLLAFDLVAADVPGMRDNIRSNVLKLANRLVKYGWTFPRPHGNVSIPVVPSSITIPKELSPDGKPQTVTIPGGNGHFFDNFMSPEFMLQVPMARLNIAQAARHVADNGGTPAERAQWNAVWAEELASQLPVLAFSMEFDAIQPNEEYYKYNLHHLTGFTITRLERDPDVRAAFKQAIGVMDKTTGDDMNAHFEAITYALSGERRRLDAAVTHLDQWLDYRANTHAGPVFNSPRCTATDSTAIECVPQDQMEVGDAVIPATSAVTSQLPPPLRQNMRMRARFPLPVAERTPTDFLWQRPPTQLDGSESATHQTPGVDFLTPYWTIRYFTEVAPPALDPFPAWAGPAHR